MKIKVIWILFLGMCIMVCPSTTGAISMVKAVNMPEQQFIIAQGNLKIINAVSSVNHGGTGVITIQGTPNTQYYIKTSYKVENKTVKVIQWRTTDKTGVAIFNWIVGNDTASGTYPATIAGGGGTLNTNHIVLQY